MHFQSHPNCALLLLFADFQEKVDDITYLKNRDSRGKRGAVSDDFYLWPNGIIPYNLTSYFTGVLVQKQR